MNTPLSFVRTHSRALLLVLCVLQVVLVGILDYVTGPNLAFSIFYLFPILLSAYSLGRRSGFMISVASAIAWFAADLSEDLLTPAPHPHHTGILVWNALVGLNFFIIISYTISALRRQQERQAELMQFVVHDLRSPLSNVIMGLKSLQSNAADRMDDRQRTVVSIALNSSNSMLTLINSLLDLSKLESGQFVLEQTEVPVRELLATAFEQVSLLAERRRVELISRPAPEIETVYADKTLTIRILVNVLVNAIKFTPEGKTVTVELAKQGPGTAIFTVTDEGKGIPKEWVPKVFDKFVQVDAQHMVVAGSGLGLTFCRMGVVAQGGRIWVESETGVGTSVRFTLPLRGPVSTNSIASDAGA